LPSRQNGEEEEEVKQIQKVDFKIRRLVPHRSNKQANKKDLHNLKLIIIKNANTQERYCFT